MCDTLNDASYNQKLTDGEIHSMKQFDPVEIDNDIDTPPPPPTYETIILYY